MSKVTNTKAPAATACKQHPAFEADNCPTCGTAQPVGATTAQRVAAAAKATTKATAKAPAKAASKATTKAPAKAASKAPAKAPAKPAAKRTTKASGPAHPGGAWLMVLDKKGLSQSEAARQMGVAPMTLNRLLNGHGIPTAKVAVAFARVTEQKVEDVWQQVADYELALVLAAGGAK